jgi:hypothetical protein
MVPLPLCCSIKALIWLRVDGALAAVVIAQNKRS